jgi:hypothetical protein
MVFPEGKKINEKAPTEMTERCIECFTRSESEVVDAEDK